MHVDLGALERNFEEVAVDRGWDYFEERRIEIVDFGPPVVAHVRGQRHYTVAVFPADDGLRATCSCPAFRKWGPCKHIFATLLELRDAQAHEDETGRRTVAWRERAGLLRHALSSFDPWTSLDACTARPMFALDLARTRRHGEVELFVRFRRRLKDGSWSKPKKFDFRQRVHAVRFAPAAWDLLNRARSAAGEALHYGDDVGHLSLDQGAAKPVLLDLAGHGWLHVYDASSDAPAPVALDAGPPWELELFVERDATRDRARLDGRFVRGEACIGLDVPDLILACGLLVARGALARVELHDAMPWVLELRRAGAIEAPLAEAGELVQTMLDGPGGQELRLAGVPTVSAPAPGPRLELRYEQRGRIECGLAFAYGATVVAAHDARARLGDGRGAFFVRRFEAERAALARFVEAGGVPGGVTEDADGWLPRADATRIAIALLREGWAVFSDDLEWRESKGFDLRVRSGIDWFDVAGGLKFAGQTVALPAVLAALREGRNEVKLEDGAVGILPEDTAERLGLLGAFGRTHGDAVRFTRTQGWLIDALLAEREPVQADRGFAALRRRFAAFDGIEPRDPPAAFRGSLRPYQREALGWFEFLERMGLGGCLADDMGLGKTVMVLAWLLRGGGTSLVVAPKSLVWNWLDEVNTFAPTLKVLDYTGLQRRKRLESFPEHDLVVTTYGVLRRDAALLAEIAFHGVVLDEAQAVKNPTSQAAKAARLLQAQRRLALTGTPVENHLGDIWSIMEFLNPGMLGPPATFKRWSSGNGVAKEDRRLVARALRPVLLRRTKAQVLSDLPTRTETTLHCEMGPKQAKAYRELADYYRAKLLGRDTPAGGLGRMKLQVLEALLRLRQAACHPGLFDAELRTTASAKFDTLLPMLEELRESGHKALVFSQFTKLLALLRERLDADGVRYQYLDGRTRKRAEAVRRFQEDDEVPHFLISLKAGGTGLNLTAANYIFLLDPWWNPAVESQAIDRAHRIGQPKPVTAYRLVCKDTVEDRILELQDRKRELADAIVRAEAGPLKTLTREDLEHLLDCRKRT